MGLLVQEMNAIHMNLNKISLWSITIDYISRGTATVTLHISANYATWCGNIRPIRLGSHCSSNLTYPAMIQYYGNVLTSFENCFLQAFHWLLSFLPSIHNQTASQTALLRDCGPICLFPHQNVLFSNVIRNTVYH